jgi:hypothetical protein
MSSIVRIEEQNKKKQVEAGGKLSSFQPLFYWFLVWRTLSTLKMEAICSSEAIDCLPSLRRYNV